MTYVVTDNCVDCRFTECVTVCPVECFHLDERQLYIDPGVCIDCGACSPACPVEAIYEAGILPDDKKAWAAINAERAPRFPVVASALSALTTAEGRRSELGF